MSKKTITMRTYGGLTVSATFDPTAPATDVSDIILAALGTLGLDEDEEWHLTNFYTLENLE